MLSIINHILTACNSCVMHIQYSNVDDTLPLKRYTFKRDSALAEDS